MEKSTFAQQIKDQMAAYTSRGNAAPAVLVNHLRKVEKMTEAEFAVHYANLQAFSRPAAVSVVRKLRRVKFVK